MDPHVELQLILHHRRRREQPPLHRLYSASVARASSIRHTMLQSIKPRIQQHDRLSTTSSESPILAPKQDHRRRISRQTPPPRLAPKTTARPQQHRRHLSVPDNFLNSIHGFGVDPVLQQKYQINTFNATGDDGRRHNNFHIPNFLQLHQPPSSHISIAGSQQQCLNREASFLLHNGDPY